MLFSRSSHRRVYLPAGLDAARFAFSQYNCTSRFYTTQGLLDLRYLQYHALHDIRLSHRTIFAKKLISDPPIILSTQFGHQCTSNPSLSPLSPRGVSDRREVFFATRSTIQLGTRILVFCVDFYSLLPLCAISLCS